MKDASTQTYNNTMLILDTNNDKRYISLIKSKL